MLSEAPARGRMHRYFLRGLVDGLRYRTKTGRPLRNVPNRYGPSAPTTSHETTHNGFTYRLEEPLTIRRTPRRPSSPKYI